MSGTIFGARVFVEEEQQKYEKSKTGHKWYMTKECLIGATSKLATVESYRSQKRPHGCGRLRLGTTLELSDGIFSIVYVANFKREYFKLSLPNVTNLITLVPPSEDKQDTTMPE